MNTALKELENTPTILTPRTIGGLTVRPVQEAVEFINLLVYGEPGVGKTVLAASAAQVPDMCPVLIIDIEGGTLSAAKMGYECEVVRVTEWVQMQRVYDDLYRNRSDFRTVVFDSLTEIQKFSMAQIMKHVVEADSDRDPDVPSIREWGKNGEQTRRLVRGFRDLPMHTIFTCLADADRDSQGNVTKTRPSLSGKLKNEVAGYVDIVAYMYKKTIRDQVERALLLSGTDKYVAKDRSHSLPNVMLDPNMTTIFATIMHNNNDNQEN
jgi:hypothetical protein